MMTVPPRALEALRLSVHGRNEAARRMGVSPATVKNHLTRAYCLLGAYSLVDAYQALGWLQIPGEGRE